VVDEFVDGVWLVELAPVSDPDLAATAIANWLEVRLQPKATVVESIVEWCRDRRALLLVRQLPHLLDAVPARRGAVALIEKGPAPTIVAVRPAGDSGFDAARSGGAERALGSRTALIAPRVPSEDGTAHP